MSEADFIAAGGTRQDVLMALKHAVKNAGGSIEDIRQLIRDEALANWIGARLAEEGDLSRWIESVDDKEYPFVVDYGQTLERMILNALDHPSAVIKAAALAASPQFAAQFPDPEGEGRKRFEGVLFCYRPHYFQGWPELLLRMGRNGYRPARVEHLFSLVGEYQPALRKPRLPVIAAGSRANNERGAYPFVVMPDKVMQIGLTNDEDPEKRLSGKVYFLGVRELPESNP